jgi:hypothetical protein
MITFCLYGGNGFSNAEHTLESLIESAAELRCGRGGDSWINGSMTAGSN